MENISVPKKPKNIISKTAKVNPEEILKKELEIKFGDRFKKYRENYNNVIDDYKHQLFFDYPLTVNLELVLCVIKNIEMTPKNMHLMTTC